MQSLRVKKQTEIFIKCIYTLYSTQKDSFVNEMKEHEI